ncbi:MAG: disulfide bond formation protein B [Pseudomonadota bacterium]
MIESLLRRTQPEVAVALCVGTSGALIAGAHLFERVGNLPPCLLCLDQREVHWAAIITGLVALGAGLAIKRQARLFAAVLGGMTLIYLFSAGLAGYHAGVESGFWPGPAGCAVSGDMSLAAGTDILNSLSEPTPGPSCTEALWRLFGISMAGYNVLISLAMAGLAGIFCLRAAGDLKQNRVNAAAFAE